MDAQYLQVVKPWFPEEDAGGGPPPCGIEVGDLQETPVSPWKEVLVEQECPCWTGEGCSCSWRGRGTESGWRAEEEMWSCRSC